MAHLLPAQKHYDVLAEALLPDGRVVKRVEARADSVPDIAKAFELVTAEARQAHLPPARIRLTASRAGTVEVATTVDLHDVLNPVDATGVLGKESLVPDLPVGTQEHRPTQPEIAGAPGGTKCNRCGKPGLHICMPANPRIGEVRRLLRQAWAQTRQRPFQAAEWSVEESQSWYGFRIVFRPSTNYILLSDRSLHSGAALQLLVQFILTVTAP